MWKVKALPAIVEENNCAIALHKYTTEQGQLKKPLKHSGQQQMGSAEQHAQDAKAHVSPLSLMSHSALTRFRQIT